MPSKRVKRSLRRAVYVAIALQTSADLQRDTARYRSVTFLSPGEVERCVRMLDAEDGRPQQGIDRAWEYFCYRAGVSYRAG